jgi:hypothetical protein
MDFTVDFRYLLSFGECGNLSYICVVIARGLEVREREWEEMRERELKKTGKRWE